jgi:uncharacterized protein YwgA
MRTDDTGTILYMLAKELGLRRDTMEDRLKLQKTVYLLQSCGLNLGYGFSWYRYGPYSQELVYDAYGSLYAENGKCAQQAQSLRLSANTRDWLRRFKATLGQWLSDAGQLELLASVGFVRKTWHADVKQCPQKFKQHKTRLFDGTFVSDAQIKAACQKLDQLEAILSR